MPTNRGDFVEGVGSAGTAIGGVLTVQGVAGGVAITTSGTATVSGTVAVSSVSGTVAVSSVGGTVAVSGTVVGQTQVWDGAAWQSMAQTVGDARANTGVVAMVPHLNSGAGLDRQQEPLGDARAVAGIASVGPMMWNGATWDRSKGDATNGLKVSPKQITISAGNGLSAANTAQTVTLAAPGAGLFHYITHIRLTRVATAALAGSAAVSYTTTNLGTKGWSVGNAMAAGGTQIDADQEYATPIRSAVANTATTIVAAAMGAAVSSRIDVDYYVGP